MTKQPLSNRNLSNRNGNIYIRRSTFTLMFITSSFKIVKIGRQIICPSTYEYEKINISLGYKILLRYDIGNMNQSSKHYAKLKKSNKILWFYLYELMEKAQFCERKRTGCHLGLCSQGEDWLQRDTGKLLGWWKTVSYFYLCGGFMIIYSYQTVHLK